MEWKPKRRSVPAGFADAIANGFDYDSTHTESENREQAGDEGFLEPELISDEEFDMWRHKGEKLLLDAAIHQWNLGDWIVEGEVLKEIAGITRNQDFKHGIYSFAADITGFSVATIKDYAYVARSVPEEIRDSTLSFGHHKLIAGLSTEQQLEFLSVMKVGNLSVGAARRRIQFLLKQRQSKSDPEPKDRQGRKRRPKDTQDLEPEKIVVICDQLLALLNSRTARMTPAAYWTLILTAATVAEVLEETGSASVCTDAGAS